MAEEKDVVVPEAQLTKMRAMMEIELRAKIRAEFEAKLKDPKALGSGPRYKALAKCYLNDITYEEGELFVWDGVPGYYMEPINDQAKAKMKAAGLLDKAGKVLPMGDVVAEGASI